MNNIGYQPGTQSSGPHVIAALDDAHDKRKKEYLSYLDSKADEISEQKDARRYYHASQWTSKQIKAFNARRQPVVTYNRIGRKINAVVGLLERQRQDPRGFPRTPEHEDGAEIATAVLRYVCDQQEWPAKSPIAGLNGAVDGIGGIELMLEPGDKGDVEVAFDTFDPGSFFYDPRSLKMDFADARFMGIGKWADVETTVEMFPDLAIEIRGSLEKGSELTSSPDSDDKWLTGSENARRIRIVDHWYIRNGEWHYCVYTGSVVLAEGISPFRDEKKRTICKFIAFSANVDHDGDRYGFVRNMRSAQDEINQRRSKGLHLLNSRRLIIADNEGHDIEGIRKEAARPDGVILYPSGTTPPEFDDNSKNGELAGQLGFLEDAKQEIENYGFNPALMGSGVQDMSGRAIQLQQQAGIAELGPYLLAFKGWKLRVYRAIWNAVQEHWTTERWIRVTDDEQVAQFFAVNQPATDEMGMPVLDPMTGEPRLVNQLGALDVDIIIDEGPDTINMQADAYDTLSIMASKGAQVPPRLLLELSPLAGAVKKKAIDILEKAEQQAMQANQPGPVQQAGIQIELEAKQRESDKTAAETAKIVAETQQLGQGDQGQMIEVAAKVQDQQFRQQEHAANMQIKQLDVAGKVIGLETAKAKANQPPPVQRIA